MTITLERWTEQYGAQARERGWQLVASRRNGAIRVLIVPVDAPVSSYNVRAFDMLDAAERGEMYALTAVAILARESPTYLDMLTLQWRGAKP